jgi:GT2 family glycosyltransferase
LSTSEKAAVVILNWNGVQHLRSFLPSVVKHTPSDLADVVVIDNHSSDDSVAFVSKQFPSVVLVHNPQNLGFAGGYNEGLKSIAHQKLILLNSDVEVQAGWLPPLLQSLSKPHTGAAQPVVRSFSDPEQFEYAGAAGGFIDKYGYPFCRGRIFHHIEPDRHQYVQADEIFWASGACMAVNREAFEKAGGFDEDFFAHMEEIDLCWRMKNLGYTVQFCPDSVILHLGGGTLSAIHPKKTYLNFRNNLMMLAKNLPLRHLLKVLPFRLLMDGVAGFYFLLQGKPAHCFSVVKAHFSFYAAAGRLSAKRKMLRGQRREHLTGVYQGSLVMESFLKGLKSFSQLDSKKFS